MEERERSTVETEGIAEQMQIWYENVTYEAAKIFIKSDIESAARSFIAIGYYLKAVRDHEMYQEDGHASVWEFAQAEYGISKSTASRYMTMNDRFSKKGNSPVIADEYKEFGKSQLQEMLYLTDEQMEQVTPDMKYREIRSMRPPKEIPYVAIPGQFELSDFPGVDPEDVTDAVQAREEILSSKRGEPAYTIRAEDLVESVAAPQQAEKTGKCLHRPEFDCALEESHKLTPGTGEDCSQVCCWECIKHGDCGLECYSSERRTTEAAAQMQQKMEEAAQEQWEPEGKETPRSSEENVPETRNDIPETVIDGEFTEVQEQDKLTPEYFLEEQKEKLDQLLKSVEGKELNPVDAKFIERQKTIVCALASLVCDLEAIEFQKHQEEERPKQPELPVLKNNDQRAAFVDAYETWPLWIETVQTGEQYYRYDLKDGSSMVVKVYHARLFDYKATSLKYEERFTEGYGRHEYYLLQPEKFFRDCETNRSLLIEKLKEIQKPKKG